MGDNYLLPIPDPRMPDRHPHVPLAVATRGGAEESVHYGAVAVVDCDGRLLHAAGDPHASVFTRSTLKPLQALAFVRDGGAERFGFSEEQVALLCASHAGEPRHVAGVADMLSRAGNAPEQLQCGTHVPGWYDLAGTYPPPPPYSPLAHNCSGKHAGMLAACALHGWRRDDYLDPEHPLQVEIRASVAAFSGVPAERMTMGIDGCSAPNFALPLAALAHAFARLATGDADPQWNGAPRRLRDAMAAHPGLVSGAGHSDEALMLAGGGDWIAKIGADGVQVVGVASLGLGIALKIADGGRRAIAPATVAVLDALGLLDDARRAALARLAAPTIRNYRGIATGAIRPVVTLARC